MFGATNAVAFEPEPKNYKLMELNFSANNLNNRTQGFNCALSDRSGDAWMELSPDNWGNHYIRFAEPAGPAVKVSTQTFDSIAGEGLVNLQDAGMIWMDVEGSELDVLKGGKSILAADVPLVMEYWPDSYTDDAHRELLAILRDSYGTYLDLRDPAAEPTTTRDLTQLRSRMDGKRVLTDLLLVKAE